MPGKDQLVEDVALELVRLEKGDVALGHRHENTPTWQSALVQARAAVEVVLGEARERVAAMVNEPSRDENGDQSYGYGLGLEAALAALVSLGKEGGREQVFRDAGASGATTDGGAARVAGEGENRG